MKIIVTGSLGNISKPLTSLLVSQGHTVTVISSDPRKMDTITGMGATPAIGSLEDGAFLSNTFTSADALYAMIPMDLKQADQQAYMRRIARNYVQAVKASGIKRVVVLSGWAANLVSAENVEDEFEQMPGVTVSVLRPAYFYTNFYFSADMIRGKGGMGKLLALRYLGLGALLRGRTGLLLGNFGGDDRIVFVSPADIAAAAAEALQSPAPDRVRYVGSEEMTCNEAAAIIGASIGKPWLQWVRISDRQMLQGLKMAKMPQQLAETMVAMQAAMHSGKALEQFHLHQPPMGKVKLAAFAREFAAAYHHNKS